MTPYPFVELWRERPGLTLRCYGITIWSRHAGSTREAGSGMSWYEARRLFAAGRDGTRTVAGLRIEKGQDPSLYEGPPYRLFEELFDESHLASCTQSSIEAKDLGKYCPYQKAEGKGSAMNASSTARSGSAPKTPIRIRCSRCGTTEDACISVGFARWFTLPIGWWILLDCVGVGPTVRCPKCL